MRWVIIGAGAVGGVLGAGLHQAGQEVLLIARGAHRDAIAARGLTLETPAGRTSLALPVVGTPAQAGIGEDDVVVLATKSQDSAAALAQLAAAARPATPVLCAQNGVSNERTALRWFANVYGGLVLAGLAHLEPGVVQSYGTSSPGSIDVGRYPGGVDDRCRQLVGSIRSAGWHSVPRPDIMAHKHAKLLANLSNVLEVICQPGASRTRGPGPGPGPGPGHRELAQALRREGEAVLAASGTETRSAEREPIELGEIGGRGRPGGSTWQSAARGAPDLETDYLNGEIVLLGRLYGVPTALNERVVDLAHLAVREGLGVGWLSPEEVLDAFER